MIDPILSLAFSLFSSPGVHALMLGSGISRSAGIPTGWEVVLDLCRKLAVLQGEDCGTDPAMWYRNKYKEEPDYSKILDFIAPTPEARQLILRNYFEPDEEDRSQGRKVPTKAHRSIAQLMAKGVIKVVLTTNFDRLLEMALHDEGVVPAVISTTDGIKGALPLIHQKCCIVKLHGDYLDTRIRNTAAELESYDLELNCLLDQILDQFGLVYVGWSAQWDTALYSAIMRCPARRFASYWATIDAILPDKVEKLVNARGFSIIRIDGADSFFGMLREKIESLYELSMRSHPLSVATAVASVKRYLTSDHHRINLHDIFKDVSDGAVKNLKNYNKELLGAHFDDKKLKDVFENYWVILEPLLTITAHGCYWAQGYQQRIIENALQSLANMMVQESDGRRLDDRLELFPVIVLIYVGGISSLATNSYDMLSRLLLGLKVWHRNKYDCVIMQWNWWGFRETIEAMGYKGRNTPVSEMMYSRIRPFFSSLVDGDTFERFFNKFECFLGITYADLKKYDLNDDSWWGPVGIFCWKDRYWDKELDNLSILQEEALKQGEAWGALKAGFFESSLKRFILVRDKYHSQCNKIRAQWHC